MKIKNIIEYTVNFLRLLIEHLCIIIYPTSDDPVNEILSTKGWSTIYAPVLIIIILYNLLFIWMNKKFIKNNINNT